MSQLFQEIESVSFAGTLKFYLNDEGTILAWWKDAHTKRYYFDDYGAKEIEDAVAGVQGMVASRALVDLQNEDPILNVMGYALFGHYVEAGNKLE